MLNQLRMKLAVSYVLLAGFGLKWSKPLKAGLSAGCQITDKTKLYTGLAYAIKSAAFMRLKLKFVINQDQHSTDGASVMKE